MESRIIKLSKYRTIGNSFIIVDNRDGSFNDLSNNTKFKRHLNQQHFGIGSAGIVEVRSNDKYPFEMIYHVGSGERGLACGTGSRCLVAFARDVGLIGDGQLLKFLSHEGERACTITDNRVTTSMSPDCRILVKYDEMNYFVDVKTFIHVRFIQASDDLEKYNVVEEGCRVVKMPEYEDIFPAPTFMVVQVCDSCVLKVRCHDITTVECQEVFACGTGETAAVVAYLSKYGLVGKQVVTVCWKYGVTEVTMIRSDDDVISDVSMSSEAFHVFDAFVDVGKFKKAYPQL